MKFLRRITKEQILSIFSDPKFIDWKNKIRYELKFLKQDPFINGIDTLLDSFKNGWDDEIKFAELESQLSILKKNIDKYLMSTNETEEKSVLNNKKVFIVHGHDEQLLNEVELMLHRIGLEPVILKNEEFMD